MIILYGAGKYGQEALKSLGKENVSYFIDNYKEGEIDGIPIFKAEEGLKNTADQKIFICMNDFEEVGLELRKKGLEYDVFFPGYTFFDEEIKHGNWPDFLIRNFDKKGKKVLEIGSRNDREDVNGKPDHNDIKSRFLKADYVGFDICQGRNVDVVGDAHRLSQYFAKGERFDLVISSAVFEHLAMPWLVTEEISKVLAIGGAVFIETHFAYSAHARPCDYFRFSDQALRILFPEELGFKVEKTVMSNPLKAVFDERACPYLVGRKVNFMWCHSSILARKLKEVEDFDWSKVNLDRVVDMGAYPEPIHKDRK